MIILITYYLWGQWDSRVDVVTTKLKTSIMTRKDLTFHCSSCKPKLHMPERSQRNPPSWETLDIHKHPEAFFKITKRNVMFK
jgi:hypothetical protein